MIYYKVPMMYSLLNLVMDNKNSFDFMNDAMRCWNFREYQFGDSHHGFAFNFIEYKLIVCVCKKYCLPCKHIEACSNNFFKLFDKFKVLRNSVDEIKFIFTYALFVQDLSGLIRQFDLLPNCEDNSYIISVKRELLYLLFDINKEAYSVYFLYKRNNFIFFNYLEDKHKIDVKTVFFDVCMQYEKDLHFGCNREQLLSIFNSFLNKKYCIKDAFYLSKPNKKKVVLLNKK